MGPAGRTLAAGLALALLAAAGRGQAVPLVEKLAARQLAAGGGGGPAEAVRRVRLGELTRVPDPLADPAGPPPADAADRFARLAGADGLLVAEFRGLSPAEQRLALELGAAVEGVLRRYPADGELLLHHLGADGLALTRAYGDFVPEVAHWLLTDGGARELTAVELPADEAAAAARTLGLPAAPRTLGDEHLVPLWLAAVRRGGDAAGRHWRDAIRPRRERWVSDGRLLTYLTRPERFEDATPPPDDPAAAAPAAGEPLDPRVGWPLVLALLVLAALPWVWPRARRGPAPPSPRHEPFRE